MTTTTGLRVGDPAAACGISTDTVRYYERAGLLPQPPRTAAGYRVFGAQSVERVRFIQGSQRLGLRLAEIGDLLAIRDTGTCPCEPAEVLLRRRITEIDAELARLAQLRGNLLAMADALPSTNCPDPSPGTWCPPAGGR